MPQPWWLTEEYRIEGLYPPGLSDLAGPRGLAYVQVYDDDKTAPGWGAESFMDKYLRQSFSSRRADVLQQRHGAPFALVTRSVRVVAIDIDGKNGGIQSAKMLNLPPTMAETSKSGSGFHLLYEVQDTWDSRYGFNGFQDRIAFEIGVDIRGTGCLFHHDSQRWNNLLPAPLPVHVKERLEARAAVKAETAERIKAVLLGGDEEEILMLQDTIQSRLTAPIPAGRRNNTLYAIGVEMAQANVPNWEQQVYDRAIEVGLDDAEASKLVKNVRRYA